MCKTMKSLTVATYNVHMWCDKNHSETQDRMIELTKKYKPDILCLQEATKRGLDTFVTKCGYAYFASYNSVAILSKLPMDFFPDKTSHVRYLVGKLQLDDEDGPSSFSLFITCVHLDHRTEPRRIRELKEIVRKSSYEERKDQGHLWVGDFNSLTREDYSNEEWTKIARIRALNCWEKPRVELTDLVVKKHGFQDTWKQFGGPSSNLGSMKTCRFDTHIDYIYANPKVLSKYWVSSVMNVDDSASDHNMIITTFQSKKK